MAELESTVIEATIETGATFEVDLSSSPTIEVEVIGSGPVGPQGTQGPPGQDGADGQNGQDGADGVSPVISSASITGGHRLTIVDAGGTTIVDVMDGQDGQDGQDGVGVPASGSTGQVLAKKSDADYDTEWVTPSAGSNDVEWVTYGSTTSATIETAYQAGKIVAVLSGDRVHYLQKRNSSTDHLFYAAIDTRFYVCRCTSNSWSNYYYECLELGDTGTIPSGGNAGQLLAKNSATDYDVHWVNKTQDYPSAYCTTTAATAAKKASCSLWVDTANSYLHVLLGAANTSAGAITLNVNSTGAKPIYINGTASSATNYTLPAGSYLVFYDGTNFYFRTDGKLTANITGTADGNLTTSDAATATPSDLGTAVVGTSAKYAREDHVHGMPSAADVGALPVIKYYSGTYNINSITGGGLYFFDSSTTLTNAPTSVGWLQVLPNSAKYFTQIWFNRTNASSTAYDRIWLRTCYNNSFTDWARIDNEGSEYKPGTYTIAGLYVYGWITGSQKSLVLMLPGYKGFHYANTVKVTALTNAELRTVAGKYVVSSGADLTSYLSSGGTSASLKGSHIAISITNSGTWKDNSNAVITNNTPIVGMISATITVT